MVSIARGPLPLSAFCGDRRRVPLAGPGCAPCRHRAGPARAAMRCLPRVLLAWLVLVAAVPAQAQWAWRDKDGRVTASDRPPPPDVPAKDVLRRPAADARRVMAPIGAAAVATQAASAGAAQPASAASGADARGPNAPRGPLEREVEARRRALEQEQAAKARAESERLAAQRADNCRRARGQLAALDSGQRLARINERGEREVIDEASRASDRQRAQDVIASDCR